MTRLERGQLESQLAVWTLVRACVVGDTHHVAVGVLELGEATIVDHDDEIAARQEEAEAQEQEQEGEEAVSGEEEAVGQAERVR